MWCMDGWSHAHAQQPNQQQIYYIYTQSQPISAVLPDVRQVEVQRPHSHSHSQHAHHQQPQQQKKQSVDLLDLVFAPSSPERPPVQQQQSQGGFAADAFASNSQAGVGGPSSLSMSASQGVWELRGFRG